MADKQQHTSARRRKRRWPLAAAALLLACAAILADSRWRIQVTEYELFSSRLPENFDGFRIVQLSDLHGMEFGQDNVRLVDQVRQARPDIIVLTGDFIEGTAQLPVVEALCTQLTAIDPTYFVSGNHDAGSGELAALDALLEACGVKYLKNEYLTLERGGEKIVLCGVEDPNTWAVMPKPDEVVATLREEYPDEYVVFLGHRNDWPEKYPLLDVDVILCGHGHGGIVRVPFAGGLFGTNAELFPEYDAGVFETWRYDMVVSRGLGGFAYVPRFLNNPHIPVVVLRSE